MSQLSVEDAQRLPGRQLYAADGSKIGKVSDILVDADTQRPEWALVNTGLFGTRESLVPLAQAEIGGEDLRVPYTKDQVKDAPQIDVGDELSQDDEAVLYRHYGLNYSESRSDSGLPTGADTGYAAPTADAPVGRDVSGPTTDDAMTRSEEEVRVSTERRPAGRVRLRKHVVTEQVTQTVPVSREEVRLEREPITEGNYDAAMAGPELSEEEHEVILREERPVVDKQVVPKERVRLGTEEVVGQETVSAEAAKERIEVEEPSRGTDPGPETAR